MPYPVSNERRAAPKETPLPPPPPAPSFLDQIGASFRTAADETEDARRGRVYEAYDGLAQTLQDMGHDPASLRRDPLWGLLGPVSVDGDKVWQAVEAERQRNPSAFKNIPATREEFEVQVRRRNGGRDADLATLARGGGVSGFAANVIGGTAVDIGDSPAGPLSLMLGGGGKTVLQTMLREGVINAGQELAMTPDRMRGREALGERMTGAEAALNVGSAFLGGALLGGAGEGLGKAIDLSRAGLEKAIAANWDRLPDGLRTRWEARATLDPAGQDVLLADLSEAVIGKGNMSQVEVGAAGLLRREGQIDAANPFVGNGAGTAAHMDALAQTMARIISDTPAEKPAFVRPRAGEALPGLGRGDTAIGSGTVAGDAQSRFMGKVRAAESSGNDAAAAGTSSAYGRYQFTKGTWISYFERRFGTAGLTRAEILAKRSDGRLQDILMADMTADSAAHLRRIGAPVTEGNLYLMHFLGPGDAEKVLRAHPDTPLEGLISYASIEANASILRGRKAGDAIRFADRKMGSAGSDGAGLHLRPDVDIEAGIRAQIDDDLARLRADNARIDAELRAQGVDTEALIAGMDGQAGLVPVERTASDLPTLAEAAPAPRAPNPDEPRAEVQAILPQLRQIVDDRQRSLKDLDVLAKDLGVPVQDLREGLTTLVREGSLSQRRDSGAFVRRPPKITRDLSLLEWIAQRGGVNDTGGDLKAIGLDRWHREGPFRRKLIRSFDPRASTGGISGAGDFGLDSTLRAAVDEGYFPELAHIPPQELDTQSLIDAMTNELHGQRRFTEDAQRARDAKAAAAMPSNASPASGVRPLDPEELDFYMREIADAAERHFGIDPNALDEEFLTYAANLRWFAQSGMEPDEAFRRSVNDYANAERYDALDEAGDQRYEDIYEGDPEYRRQDSADAFRNAGYPPDGYDPAASEDSFVPAGSGEEGGRIPLEDLPREEAGLFLDPGGEAGRVQADSLEHDARAAIDPNIAARQKQEAQLRAEAPLRGENASGQAQDGTMGLGLFDAADNPQFDLGPDSSAKSVKDLLASLDEDAADLDAIRSCMNPKPKGEA